MTQEHALDLAFHRIKGLLTRTEHDGLGLRKNTDENSNLETLTLYDGGYLVIHISHTKTTYTLGGYDYNDNPIDTTVHGVTELAEEIESIIFE